MPDIGNRATFRLPICGDDAGENVARWTFLRHSLANGFQLVYEGSPVVHQGGRDKHWQEEVYLKNRGLKIALRPRLSVQPEKRCFPVTRPYVASLLSSSCGVNILENEVQSSTKEGSAVIVFFGNLVAVFIFQANVPVGGQAAK